MSQQDNSSAIMQGALKKLNNDELKTFQSAITGGPVDEPYLQKILPKLSNQELEAFSKNFIVPGVKKADVPDVSLTDKAIGFAKDYIAAPASAALNYVGEKLDRYSAAPTRSAIVAAQKGNNPISAAFDQFGSDPDLAPRGKDIAINAGFTGEKKYELSDRTPFSGKVSPADIAGLFFDVTGDASMLLPVGAISKGLKGSAKIAGELLELTARGADELNDSAYFTKIVKGAGNKVDTAANFFKNQLSPKQAVDFEELRAIADKNGFKHITDELEFGKESIITRAGRKSAEGVIGQDRLLNHEAAIKEVNEGLYKKLIDLSGGDLRGPIDVGDAIRADFDLAKEKIFSQVGDTYQKIAAQMPAGARLSDIAPMAEKQLFSTINSIQNDFSRTARLGATPAVRSGAKEVVFTLDQIKKSGGNFRDLVDQMQQIGKDAYSTQAWQEVGDPGVKAFRKVYEAMRGAVVDGTRSVFGEEVANKLVSNNKILSEFFENRKGIGKIIGNESVAPEDIFNRIVKNGDSLEIQALKNIVSPETLQKMRGALVDSFIKPNAEGKFTFGQLYKTMEVNEDKLRALFNPQELVDLHEIVRYGNRLGVPILSTSGTGASLSFKDMITSIPAALANETIVDSLKQAARNAAKAPEKASGLGLPPILGGKRSVPFYMFKAGQVGNSLNQDDNALNRYLQNK